MDFSIVNTPGTTSTTNYHPDSFWQVRILSSDANTITIQFLGDAVGRVNGVVQPGFITTVPRDRFIDPTFLMLEEKELIESGRAPFAPAPFYGWIPDPSVVGSEGWVAISLYWAEAEGWL